MIPDRNSDPQKEIKNSRHIKNEAKVILSSALKGNFLEQGSANVL